MKKWIFIIGLLFLMATPYVAKAQAPGNSEANLTTPPNSDGPTEIFIDLGIRNIASIDEREQTFEIDAELTAEWWDERLAFDAEAFGAESKVYQGETVLEKLKAEVWWPDFEITDSRGSRDRIAMALSIDADGYVSYRERFNVFVVQPFYLKDFPFDSHTISLNIEPFSYAADKVTFVGPEEPTLQLEWDTDEWAIENNEIVVDPGSVEDEEANPYSSVMLGITISRIPAFYIANFIIPLLMIMAISCAVFWMDFDNMHLADRLSVSFTSVLTIVAFDFVTSDGLPKLSYSTWLDNMLTVSYIFLGLIVLENVVAYTMLTKDKPETAQKIDKISRWLFPVSYILILGIVALF